MHFVRGSYIYLMLCKALLPVGTTINRVAFRKLRRGGQVCEQGSFEGAGLHAYGKLGGSGGMLHQEIFEKRHALRSILVYFWPSITCIILYQYQVLYIQVSENLGGGGGG